MEINLPTGFQSRPAAMNDLAAAIDLYNACSRDVLGTDEFTLSRCQRDWQTPGFNLEADTCLVIAPGGQIAGYFEIWDFFKPHVTIDCWGRVHPDFANLGVGQFLLEWGERRARQGILKAPADTRVVLQTFINSLFQRECQLFEQAGFQPARRNLRMLIELPEPPPPPCWPSRITVRTFVAGQDEHALVGAVRDAFQDHRGYVERPFEQDLALWEYRIADTANFDPSLWFLALDCNEIVGTSICTWKSRDDPDLGWVHTLGVKRAWRRQGIATALLQHSFAELHRRGRQRVGLGVDAKSLTGATRLYLKAGMHPDPKHEFIIYIKELRPGRDLRKQTVE
ncbi:MAG TPA: GNAT family N-acetyltransferase [Anaerolineales bacterium]